MTESIDIGTTNLSKTYKKNLSCLNLYITVTYKEDGKVDYIRINGTNKQDVCGISWIEAISDLLTFSIRRIRNKHEAKAICKALRDHKCLGIAPNKEHIQSCSDAIGRVMMEVLQITEDELRGRK